MELGSHKEKRKEWNLGEKTIESPSHISIWEKLLQEMEVMMKT